MTLFQPVKVRSGRMTLLIIALIIISLLATGFVWAHKTVHIVVDGSDLAISTLSGKPDAVLAQAGVTLAPQDEYRLSTPKLTDGTVIEVFRAVPVTLAYQGEDKILVTGKPTVGELAASLGIRKENVKLVPGENTRIQSGMIIQAIVISEKVIEREQVEPFPVVHQPDATLEKGIEEVAEEGQNGSKTVKIRQHFADGSVTGEEVLAETITTAPKPKIIRVGTRDTVETSRGAMRFKRTEVMEATAYLPTDGSSEGLTATGIPARQGIVAVDPDVIPLGARLYVPGYGLALAADTGGAIVGSRIDLCMESPYDAWRFGRRMVKVYVLE
ncbi:MAG: 3D domain-containing protein [Veillonellales bacterium]